MKKTKAAGARAPMPTEEQILEFIRGQEAKVGKREIARAFNIRGADRIALKKILKDMAARGLIEKRAKRIVKAGEMPPVAVLDIIGPDDMGDVIARPSVWDEAEQGKAPVILMSEPRRKPGRKSEPLPGPGARVLARIEPLKSGPYPYKARVIRKLDNRANEILAVFRRDPNGGGRLIPVEKRARGEILVRPGDGADARDGELVRARIRRDGRHGLSYGRVLESLGDLNDQRNISLIAIHEQGIRDTFPQKALDEAEALKSFSHEGREDIRHIPLVTIDPRDARDHDDAVWAAPDDDPANEGGHKVIVAIADVAWYVRPGTALDAEARLRGNSTYFPDRVVPMLPERISNDLCSLREGEDRPAIACFMTFDKTGRKRAHRFARVIMRSAAFLSYQQAQAAIDGRPDEATEPLLDSVLKPLWSCHDTLMAARKRRGPLELDIPERKLILDATGLIERVVSPERLEAHKLIEELMIQANVCAAETLEDRREPFIYRIHDAPAPEKIEALAQFLRTIGISAPVGQVMKPMHFNQILEKARGTEFEHVVNQVVLRTQSQAVYSVENRGHFGLNLRRYAHFTSPIRRYADTIVHRALVSALKLGEGGLSQKDISAMEETAEMISAAERRSMAAERTTVDRMMAQYLSERVGATFDARISGVTRAGLFVALVETGADGFVPVSTLRGDYFVYDETRHALIGRSTGETYQLGDAVEVRLRETAPVAGGMRFEMVSPGKKGKRPAGGGRGKGRRAMKRGKKGKGGKGRRRY